MKINTPQYTNKLKKRRSAYVESPVYFGAPEPYEPKYVPENARQYLPLLMLDSGEIPSNIYAQIGIPATTFRGAIAYLKNKGLIRRNFSDSLHTYSLTAAGKNSIMNAVPYIRTPNVLSARKRRVRLARLNACLAGMGVSVFSGGNPPLKGAVHDMPKLYFYNSFFLKPLVSKHTEMIRRSKAFGLLCACDNNYMVYYEPTVFGTDFYFEEQIFKEHVSDYIGTNVEDMLLVVDTSEQAVFWLRFLLHHTEYFYGDRPHDFFNTVRVFVMDKYAHENLFVLLNETKIAKTLYPNFDYDESNEKMMWIKKGNERRFFMFTLNVYRLLHIIACAENRPNEITSIITSQTLEPIIGKLVKGKPITVYYYASDKWAEILKNV